ncbi:MAG: amino acid ABC transporter permease [Lachnospiraceae bacterium]|nr:amino acid ABC transporter permease [Lachnospiraceae bacterium]
MDYIIRITPQILDGLSVTLSVFAVTLVLSLPLGILIALCRVSKNRVLRGVSGFYTWILRGTPLMLQMFLIFFGLPAVGIRLFGRARMPYVYLAFVLNYAAYYAEIIRSGVQSIETGQREAATILGLSPFQTFKNVVLPQVIKKTLPAIGNEVINLIKDTSFVYALGLTEIFKIAKSISTRDVTLVPYIIVGIIYLIFTGVITKLLNLAERKVYYDE